jgi:phosphoribosylanthranilate isomerase
MIRLKVCGMRDKENIAEVSAIGLDYMGFIFYRTSPRYVGDNFVMPEISSPINRVGVFVNESNDMILDKIRKYSLDFAQLHGNEPVQQCEELKDLGVKIIKVFSVDDKFDFNTTKAYAPVSGFFLFDTKGANYGGNAKSFNWAVLKKYNQQVPFFLSGGINPGNSKAIHSLKGMNLHAADINSGVEVSPAVKDPDKVRQIKDILNSNS